MKPHEILTDSIKQEVEKQAQNYANRCSKTQEEKSLAYSAYITSADELVKHLTSHFFIIQSLYVKTAQDGTIKLFCEKCSEQLLAK